MTAPKKPATTATASERLVWVFQQVTGINKQEVNAGAGGRYKAFAIDDVYRSLHTTLADAGLYVMPQLKAIEYMERVNDRGKVSIDARLQIEYRFTAPDGSTDSMTVPGEARDHSDKATFKAMQQAFKYGLVQGFMIQTGEVDSDAEGLEAEPAVDPKAEANRAWRHIKQLFPEDQAAAASAYAQARKALKIPEDHMLTVEEADFVIAKADEIAKPADD